MAANAKNRLGGYTGVQTSAYLIRNGAVVMSVPGGSICQEAALVGWKAMDAGR